jgi:hypothetical protein
METSINVPNAVVNTIYIVNNASLSALINTLVTTISAFNVIRSASIVMGLFLIDAPVAHLRNSFSINSVFLLALMVTILV